MGWASTIGGKLAGTVRIVASTWARWVSAALGLWLMAAPAVLGYGGEASATHRLVGPVVASFAFVAVWSHVRGLRWANLPLGVLLLVVPWPLGFTPIATVNSLTVGLGLVALAPVRGPIRGRFGGGWAYLWEREARVRREPTAGGEREG